MMGVYVQQVPFINRQDCHQCGEKIKRGQEFQELSIYNDPWLTKPSTIRVHTGNDDDNHGDCLDMLLDTSWGDFRYFACAACHRTIIRQCPSNGWRSYVKERDGKEICVKCYQDEVLANGEIIEAFEGGRIPGDFYNEWDIRGNGWKPIDKLGNFFFSGSESAKRFCDSAIGLINQGKKVLVDYDSIAITGEEGYVSLFVK